MSENTTHGPIPISAVSGPAPSAEKKGTVDSQAVTNSRSLVTAAPPDDSFDDVDQPDSGAIEFVKQMVSTIAENELSLISVPVRSLAQDATNLATWCVQDRELLEKAGLNWQRVEDLPVLSGALRHAQSIWDNNRFQRNDAQQAWSVSSEKAMQTRRAVMHFMRYAFRNNAELLERVTRIAGGRTHNDLIQDMNDLYLLAIEHITPLRNVGMDEELVSQMAELNQELSVYNAQARVEHTTKREHKLLRDRIYTQLKRNMDEIRQCGQFVFWKEPARATGYTANHFRKKRKKNRTAHSETPTLS